MKKFLINRIKKSESFRNDIIKYSYGQEEERGLKVAMPNFDKNDFKIDHEDYSGEDSDEDIRYIFGNLSDSSDMDSDYDGDTESNSIKKENVNEGVKKDNSKLTTIDTNDKVKVIKSQKKKVSSARKSSVNNRKCILNILKKMRRNRF
jgi:hypothetical protein